MEICPKALFVGDTFVWEIDGRQELVRVTSEGYQYTDRSYTELQVTALVPFAPRDGFHFYFAEHGRDSLQRQWEARAVRAAWITIPNDARVTLISDKGQHNKRARWNVQAA